MKPKKKRRILQRDGHRCRYCGEPKPARELTIDHVVPRSAGGTSEYSNVVACCDECNKLKANKTVDQFRALCARRGRRVSVPFPKWQERGAA